jgi:hypothetical protein
MKKGVLVSMVIFVILLASCRQGAGKGSQNRPAEGSSAGTPEIVFTEYEHNFGKVRQGSKVSHIFNFTNKGDENLVIESAVTTCGCTVPQYSKKPVAPGKEGTLEVVFDTSGRNGMQTKTITVRTNARTPVVLLKITADVESGK